MKAFKFVLFSLITLISQSFLTDLPLFASEVKLAKNQVLTVAFDSGDAKTLNPHLAGSNQDRAVADLIHNGLLRYPPGNQISLEPDLAESWEVSNDKKEYTFHLRKGVFFHPFPNYPSGYELTSEDVIFSVNRAANSNFSAYSGDYKNLKFAALDNYTLRVTVDYPISEILLLPKFSNYSGGYIVSKKAIEERGEDWVKAHPIGTGPFMFSAYEPRQKVTLIGNPQYFRGKPILEKVIIMYMPSINARESGLQTGELQMIEGLMEEKWITKIKQISNVVAEPFGPTEANMLHINMNKPPFNDLRVRKALSYAINRDLIAKFMGADIAVPIYSPALAPPAVGALTKDEALKHNVLFEDNIIEAKKLLVEAGYPNGFKTEVIISEMASSYLKPMTAIQAQVRKAGIDLDVKVVDHPSFHSLIRKDLSSLVLYSPWRPNVDNWLTRFFHSSSDIIKGKTPDTNFCHYGWVDADGDGKIDSVDDLIEKARSELDQNKQIELWKEIQVQLLKNVAVIPIMRLKYVFPRDKNVDLGHPNTWLYTTQSIQLTEKSRILGH